MLTKMVHNYPTTKKRHGNMTNILQITSCHHLVLCWLQSYCKDLDSYTIKCQKSLQSSRYVFSFTATGHFSCHPAINPLCLATQVLLEGFLEKKREILAPKNQSYSSLKLVLQTNILMQNGFGKPQGPNEGFSTPLLHQTAPLFFGTERWQTQTVGTMQYEASVWCKQSVFASSLIEPHESQSVSRLLNKIRCALKKPGYGFHRVSKQ